MAELIFFVLSLVTIVGALCTVISKNAYASALWMITSFIGVSGLFVMLNAPFIAMLQIIVYAGAIAVLILLVMMLMDRRVLEDKKRFNPQYLWAVAFGLGLLADISVLAFKFRINLSHTGENLTLNGSNTKMVGDILFKHYLFPFELIAIVLLVALVGAIVLTKEDKKEVG